jgi:hypothetical protein
MSKQELPQVGEVWGVPDEPKTWRYVANISEGNIFFGAFALGDIVAYQDWHAWIADSRAERIFPPTRVTTGPWPTHWTQIT